MIIFFNQRRSPSSRIRRR